MDRALWFLACLRLTGWLRRVGRSVATVRGALLIAVGALVFLPWVLSWLVVPTPRSPDLEPVRRWGPLVLLGYSLFTLVVVSEGALTFSAAEVNFLFPAPLSRRQLLAYKLFTVTGGCLLTALFLALCLRQMTSGFLAGLVGLLLTTLFLHLFPITLSLVASSVGASAYNRQRKIVLLVLAVAVVAVVVLYAGELAGQDRERVLRALEQSPAVQTVLAPFRWFVLTFTATTLPDLLRYAGLGLLVNAVLVGLIFGLDAHYLEASAAASERAYERLQRLRRGGPAALTLGSPGKARLTVPSLPWWGGVGPLMWRQLITLVRTPTAPLAVLLVTGAFALSPVLGVEDPSNPNEGPPLALAMLGAMLFFVTQMLPFDFRGDLDRLDVLKALPLPPWRVALGQLLVPTLVVTLVQFVCLAGLQVYWGRLDTLLLAALAFLPVLNLLMFGLDNLLFLWFPTRHGPASPGDLQTLGRHVLLWMAKMFAVGVVLGMAAGFGVVAYLLTRGSLVAAGAAAWLVMVGAAVGLVPLVGLAFRLFDVSRDMP